jgi:hypothetical protein
MARFVRFCWAGEVNWFVAVETVYDINPGE